MGWNSGRGEAKRAKEFDVLDLISSGSSSSLFHQFVSATLSGRRETRSVFMGLGHWAVSDVLEVAASMASQMR